MIQNFKSKEQDVDKALKKQKRMLSARLVVLLHLLKKVVERMRVLLINLKINQVDLSVLKL